MLSRRDVEALFPNTVHTRSLAGRKGAGGVEDHVHRSEGGEGEDGEGGTETKRRQGASATRGVLERRFMLYGRRGSAHRRRLYCRGAGGRAARTVHQIGLGKFHWISRAWRVRTRAESNVPCQPTSPLVKPTLSHTANPRYIFIFACRQFFFPSRQISYAFYSRIPSMKPHSQAAIHQHHRSYKHFLRLIKIPLHFAPSSIHVGILIIIKRSKKKVTLYADALAWNGLCVERV